MCAVLIFLKTHVHLMQISYHLDLLRSDESSENYDNSEKRDP